MSSTPIGYFTFLVNRGLCFGRVIKNPKQTHKGINTYHVLFGEDL